MIRDLVGDLRYAIRGLRRNPGFAAAAVLTLALGIGAAAAIFSLTDAIFFRPFPVRVPDRLVALYGFSRSGGAGWTGTSYPDYLEYREAAEIFSGVMAYIRGTIGFSAGDRTEVLSSEMITANYFDVLGVPLALGRSFRADEGRPGTTEPVAIVSHALWQRSLGGDPGVVGRTVWIHGRSVTVIGVVPRDFRGVTLDWGKPPDVWLPFPWIEEFGLHAQQRSLLDWREARMALVVGRLRPGVEPETAQAALDVRAARLAAAYPENRDQTVRLLPGREARFWPRYRRQVVSYLALVGGTVGLVLVLACVNLASLLLARGASRQREVAIRLALGAGRARLVRHLLAEGLVLAALALGGGLAVAYGFIGLLRRFPLPLPVPIGFNLQFGLDARVVAFAAALSALAILGSSVFPALDATRADLRTALQSESGSSGRSFRRSRLRSGLIVVEVALSLVLLSGAGLFLRSLGKAYGIDTGFRTDDVVVVPVDFNALSFRYDEAKGLEFYQRAAERVRALPGVEAAAWAGDSPFDFRRLVFFFVKEGQHPARDSDWIRLDCNVIGPGYFETVGVRLMRGREFTERDDASAPVGAVIINETMARRYWPGEDPIGKRIRVRYRARELYEIVGIARDVRQRGPWEDPVPYVYAPLRQRYFASMILHARVAGDPKTMLAAIEREIASLDSDIPVSEVRTLRAQLDAVLAQQRTAAALLGAAGALALLLAAVGVYGVLAYSVARRRREIGIRMALGADARSILGLLLRQGMTLAVAGTLLGAAAALALSRLIATYVRGIGPWDLPAFAAAAFVLLAAAAAACIVPSRRASRIDPVSALRHE